jgi:hypothetical protein
VGGILRAEQELEIIQRERLGEEMPENHTALFGAGRSWPNDGSHHRSA